MTETNDGGCIPLNEPVDQTTYFLTKLADVVKELHVRVIALTRQVDVIGDRLAALEAKGG